MALFPDVVTAQAMVLAVRERANPDEPWPVLHAFSGSIEAGAYDRLDMHAANEPEIIGDVCDAPELCGGRRYQLIIADPPYSAEDANRYDAPMVNRTRATRALAGVTEAGGYMVWLDTQWPIHSKRQWVTVGRISLWRSTNHRQRAVTIFRRVA